ncbi:LysE family translocator [Streptomyces halobius]|uniref:LysE family translocator n=1 Tax=Streptomyces halobius TaxID=2879846 RepID=A0ABY4MIT6_9ACTN|nr:LysE family translocator [Streptomyces halobius]UQA97267.1 LysE family translocator [Streptomyces halobius]
MISGFFLGSSLLVITTPGPDAALVTQLVLRTGRRTPALAAAVGMLTAGALHATLAISGVSLVLAGRPELFTAVRWCGAAVMLLWGIRALRAALRPDCPSPREPGQDARQPAPTSLRRCWLQGLLCTGSNPKVGLFLLAFLPQFVPPGDPPARTMAVLAAVHLSLAALWLAFLSGAVHLLRRWVAARRPHAGAGMGRVVEAVVGTVFIAFAVRLGLGG